MLRIDDYEKIEIENVLNNKKYFLQPSNLSGRKNTDIEEISQICNQPEIYKNLFEEMLNGSPYTKENAKGFIDWSRNGWNNNQFFVFLIRNLDENVVGCIDIKENNLEQSEIGFWLDKNHSGLMTNAVKKIVEIGRENNFKNFFGDVKPGNFKSIKVLERSSFQFREIIDGYLRYEIFI